MYEVLFFVMIAGIAAFMAWTFPGDTPWKRHFREKAEAKLLAEEEAAGYQDPSTEAIVKLLKLDVPNWTMESEYDMVHTSGIRIKHHSGEHPGLFNWYYPGYGKPDFQRRKDGYRDALSYDQRKVLEAIRIWKKLKAHEIFGNTTKGTDGQ